VIDSVAITAVDFDSMLSLREVELWNQDQQISRGSLTFSLSSTPDANYPARLCNDGVWDPAAPGWWSVCKGGYMATLTIVLSGPMTVDHVKLRGDSNNVALTVVANRDSQPVWATTFPGIFYQGMYTFATGKYVLK